MPMQKGLAWESGNRFANSLGLTFMILSGAAGMLLPLTHEVLLFLLR